MMRRRMSLLLAAVTATAGASASAQEDPTNIVADQIRAQGYKCDSPQSAKRDAQASKPDEAVWTTTDGAKALARASRLLLESSSVQYPK